jgi:hypothetical protein
MTWLTVMEYPCHKWPRICSTCRKHFPVLSSFFTYHRICNTTGATSGTGTSHPSRAGSVASFVSSNPLSRKSWLEPQALESRINWEIYTPYACAAGMLLHINGKFTMGTFVWGILHTGTSQEKRKEKARSFNFTFRYVDKVLSLNKSTFGDFVDRIYPIELVSTERYILHMHVLLECCYI